MLKIYPSHPDFDIIRMLQKIGCEVLLLSISQLIKNEYEHDVCLYEYDQCMPHAALDSFSNIYICM